MTILDFERLDATPVATDPFPHVVVPRFVHRDRLDDVVAALPSLVNRGSYPVEGLKLGNTAHRLMDHLKGETFRKAVAGKFDLDLDNAPVMVTLRGQTDSRDGNIHRDSASKRVTVLLYLNPASDAWTRQEGCLRLLRGPKDLEDYAVEVPPVDGTLLIFPNGPTTWHGHRTFTGRRYTVQLNYMTTDARARYELGRHRVSALLKRVAPAA